MAHDCTEPPPALRTGDQTAAAQRAVDALARDLHRATCEHDWKSASLPDRAAWERHARDVLRNHIARDVTRNRIGG